ncbi:hypothetical protein ABEB36_000615 [Hypothenemus hampei]|uniref:FHA domain-containing protein n=1 Tax=Hypothenemus hampei TaxID=57062 RepID=A0ABD1FBU3_HYPHA
MSSKWTIKQLTTNKIICISLTDNLVGRNKRANICLLNYKISRQHANFMVNTEGNLYVQDFKSVNGTFVNGVPIESYKMHQIGPGDIVGFGIPSVQKAENLKEIQCLFEVMEITSPNVSLNPADSTTECVTGSHVDTPIQSKCKTESNVNDVITILGNDNPKPIIDTLKAVPNQYVNCLHEPETLEHHENTDCLRRITICNNNLGDYTVSNVNSKSDLVEVKMKLPKMTIESNKNNEDNQIKKPEDCTYKTTSFTSNNQDNSIIIDLTDDADDLDVTQSQIIKIAQSIKTDHHPDDIYQKIKSELAEMDNFDEEIIVNYVPINLEANDSFQNTQEIWDLLEDEKLTSPNEENNCLPAKTTRNSEACSSKDVPVKEANIEDVINNHPKDAVEASPNKHVQCSAVLESDIEKNGLEVRRRLEVASTKNIKSSKVIMEHNTSIKLQKKDFHEPKTDPTNKRKMILKSPVKNKKLKVPATNPSQYNPKEIMERLKKRRNSKSPILDKKQKEEIKEQRRKKLKALTSPTASTTDKEPNKSMEANNSFEKNTVPSKKRIARCGSTKKNKESHYDSSLTEALPRKKGVQISSKVPAMSTISIPRKPMESFKVPKINNEQKNSVVDSVAMETKQQFKKTRDVMTSEISKRLMWSNGSQLQKSHFQKRFLHNVDDIYNKMINWVPNWLLEQVDVDNSPPVNNPPAREIPLTFQNFNHYYDTFSKLILLEYWQYLFKSFRECEEQPKKMKIEHIRINNEIAMLDCVYYLNQNESQQRLTFKNEDFVLIEYVTKDSKQNTNYINLNFAFVQKIRKSVMQGYNIISVRPDLCNGKPHTKVELTLYTSFRPTKEVNRKKMALIKPLANARSHLMLIRAIKGLEHSPLCSLILNPQINDFKFPITHHVIFHPHNLNEQQAAIVLEAASLCTGQKPGFYCVKGPPGTGKSNVIVNLIIQIIFSKPTSGKRPMILLAAPSNTAVDNILSKLLTLKSSLSNDLKTKIKCIRIGRELSIDKNVQGYSLQSLSEKYMRSKNQHIPEIKAAKRENEDMTTFLKNYFGSQYMQELKICENMMISNCNIITTTLNSCVNGRLMEAVEKGLLEFSCCIIDEATQCHEIEALLPTILGIDKLVLVGDPQQLNATIMDREAIKMGFEQSLFTRLATKFGSDPRSPIKMLYEQYRMHPEICDFPNRQFYEGKLRSVCKNSRVLQKDVRPYLVFTCLSSPIVENYTNRVEVMLIKKIVSALFTIINRNLIYKIGIITPYNAQKDLISYNLQDLIAENINCEITINTVDSFQGSEKDVIIISCVRDSTNSFLQNEHRMNVALTRAKMALYIVGTYNLFKESRLLYEVREDAKRRKLLINIRQNPETIDNLRKCLLGMY